MIDYVVERPINGQMILLNTLISLIRRSTHLCVHHLILSPLLRLRPFQ